MEKTRLSLHGQSIGLSTVQILRKYACLTLVYLNGHQVLRNMNTTKI